MGDEPLDAGGVQDTRALVAAGTASTLVGGAGAPAVALVGAALGAASAEADVATMPANVDATSTGTATTVAHGFQRFIDSPSAPVPPPDSVILPRNLWLRHDQTRHRPGPPVPVRCA